MSYVSRHAACSGALLVMFGARLGAQAQLPPAIVACNGQRISNIVIRSEPPIYGSTAARIPIVLKTQQLVHVTTQPFVIRNFLLLRTGDRCTEARRAESERILRAQPYLADARIVAMRGDGDDEVELDVQTVDEIASIAALRVNVNESPYVQKVRLGSQNMAGRGFYLSGEWEDGRAYRDGYFGRLTTSQVFGYPFQFTFTGARHPVGSELLSQLSRPFFTDFQRFAWELTIGRRADYLSFARLGDEPLSVRTERSFGDIGVVGRIGAPGLASLLLGFSVSREDERTSAEPSLLLDSGEVRLPVDSSLARMYPQNASARLNALFGFRRVRFIPVSRFEALEGTQDMRAGFQAGVLLGRGLMKLGSSTEDAFVSFDAYTGIGNPRSFLAARAQLEGRHALGTDMWDRGLSTATIHWYQRMADRQTLFTRLVWSGGWHETVPFQLVLGDREAGVIGFLGSRVGGGKRVVGRLEDRVYLGRVTGSSSVGASAFVEAGKVWAGDVPFGVTSPVAASVGVGLLAAVPPRSQRLWRLEAAVRVSQDADAGRLEFRFTNQDRARALLNEPPDVTRSRLRSVPTNMFVWPRGWLLDRR